jgi:lipoate-protein ligase B
METVTTLPSAVDWIISDAPVSYPDALAWMEARATEVAAGEARECVWLLEHPPLYTAGIHAFPCSKPGAAGVTHITAPASGLSIW